MNDPVRRNEPMHLRVEGIVHIIQPVAYGYIQIWFTDGHPTLIERNEKVKLREGGGPRS